MMFAYTFLTLLQEKINELPSNLPPKQSHTKEEKRSSSMSLDSINPIVLTVGTNSNIDSLSNDDYSSNLSFILVGSWFVFFKILLRSNLPLLGIIVLSEALLFLTSSYLVLFVPTLDAFTLVNVLYLLNIMAVEVVVAITILIRIASLRLSLEYSSISTLSASFFDAFIELVAWAHSILEYLLDTLSTIKKEPADSKVQLTLCYWGLKKLGLFLNVILNWELSGVSAYKQSPTLFNQNYKQITVSTRGTWVSNFVWPGNQFFLSDTPVNFYESVNYKNFTIFRIKNDDPYSFKNPHESLRTLKIFEQRLNSQQGRRMFSDSELYEPYNFMNIGFIDSYDGLGNINFFSKEHDLHNVNHTQKNNQNRFINYVAGSQDDTSYHMWKDRLFNKGTTPLDLFSQSTNNKKNLEPKGWTVANAGPVDRGSLEYRDFAEWELWLFGDADWPWRGRDKKKKRKYKFNRLPLVKKKYIKPKKRRGISHRSIKFLNRSRKRNRLYYNIGRWDTGVTDRYDKINRVISNQSNILNSYYDYKNNTPFRDIEKNYNVNEIFRPFNSLDIKNPNILEVRDDVSKKQKLRAYRGMYFSSPLKKNNDMYSLFSYFWDSKFSSSGDRKVRRKRKKLRFWRGRASERFRFRNNTPKYYWLSYLRRKKNKRFFRRRKWKGAWDKQMHTHKFMDKNWGTVDYQTFDQWMTEYYTFKFDDSAFEWTIDDADEALGEFYGTLFLDNTYPDILFDLNYPLFKRRTYEERVHDTWWSGTYPDFVLDENLRPLSVSRKEVRPHYVSATRKFRKRVRKKSKSLYGFSWKRHRRRLYFIRGADLAKNKNMLPKFLRSQNKITSFTDQVKVLRKTSLSKRNIPIRNYVDSLTGYYPDLLSTNISLQNQVHNSVSYLWNNVALIRDWFDETLRPITSRHVRTKLKKTSNFESIFVFGLLDTIVNKIYWFLIWTADIYVMFCDYLVSTWSTAFEIGGITKTFYHLIPYSLVLTQESAAHSAMSKMSGYYKNFFKYCIEVFFFGESFIVNYWWIYHANGTINMFFSPQDTINNILNLKFFYNFRASMCWVLNLLAYPTYGIFYDTVNILSFQFKLSPPNVLNSLVFIIKSIEIPSFDLFNGYIKVNPLTAAILLENAREPTHVDEIGRLGRYYDVGSEYESIHPEDTWMLEGDSRTDREDYYYFEDQYAHFPTGQDVDNMSIRRSRNTKERRRRKRNIFYSDPRLSFFEDSAKVAKHSDSLYISSVKYNMTPTPQRSIFKNNIRNLYRKNIRLISNVIDFDNKVESSDTIDFYGKGLENLLDLVKHNNNRGRTLLGIQDRDYGEVARNMTNTTLRTKFRFKLPPAVWNLLDTKINEMALRSEHLPSTKPNQKSNNASKPIKLLGSNRTIRLAATDVHNLTGDAVGTLDKKLNLPNTSIRIPKTFTTPLLLLELKKNTNFLLYTKYLEKLKPISYRHQFIRNANSSTIWNTSQFKLIDFENKSKNSNTYLTILNLLYQIVKQPLSYRTQMPKTSSYVAHDTLRYLYPNMYFKPFESRVWSETSAFIGYNSRGSMPWHDDPDPDSDIYDYSVSPITTRGISESELTQMPNSFMLHEFGNWLRDRDPREESLSNMILFNYVEDGDEYDSLEFDPDVLGDIGYKQDLRFSNEDIETLTPLKVSNEYFSEDRVSHFDLEHFKNNNNIFEGLSDYETKRVYNSAVSNKIWKLRGGRLGLLPARQRTKEYTKYGSGTMVNFISPRVIPDHEKIISVTPSFWNRVPKSLSSSIKGYSIGAPNTKNSLELTVGERFDTTVRDNRENTLHKVLAGGVRATKDMSVINSHKITWNGESYSDPVSYGIGDDPNLQVFSKPKHFSKLQVDTKRPIKKRRQQFRTKNLATESTVSINKTLIDNVHQTRPRSPNEFRAYTSKLRAIRNHKIDSLIAPAPRILIKNNYPVGLGREPLHYILQSYETADKNLNTVGMIENIKLNPIRYRGDYTPNEKWISDYSFEDVLPEIIKNGYQTDHLVEILADAAIGANEKHIEPSSGRKRLKVEQHIQFPYRKKKFITSNEPQYKSNDYGSFESKKVSKTSRYGPINDMIFSLYEYEHAEFDDQIHERFVNWNLNKPTHPLTIEPVESERAEESLGKLRRKNVNLITNRWRLGSVNRDSYFIRPHDEYLGFSSDEDAYDEKIISRIGNLLDDPTKTIEDINYATLLGPLYEGDTEDLDEIDDFIFEPPETSNWNNKMREFKRDILRTNSHIVPLGSKKFDSPFKDSIYGLQALSYSRRELMELSTRTAALEPFYNYYRSSIANEDSMFSKNNEREVLSYLMSINFFNKADYPKKSDYHQRRLKNLSDLTYDGWRNSLSNPRTKRTGQIQKLTKPKAFTDSRYFGFYSTSFSDIHDTNWIESIIPDCQEYILSSTGGTVGKYRYGVKDRSKLRPTAHKYKNLDWKQTTFTTEPLVHSTLNSYTTRPIRFVTDTPNISSPTFQHPHNLNTVDEKNIELVLTQKNLRELNNLSCYKITKNESRSTLKNNYDSSDFKLDNRLVRKISDRHMLRQVLNKKLLKNSNLEFTVKDKVISQELEVSYFPVITSHHIECLVNSLIVELWKSWSVWPPNFTASYLNTTASSIRDLQQVTFKLISYVTINIENLKYILNINHYIYTTLLVIWDIEIVHYALRKIPVGILATIPKLIYQYIVNLQYLPIYKSIVMYRTYISGVDKKIIFESFANSVFVEKTLTKSFTKYNTCVVALDRFGIVWYLMPIPLTGATRWLNYIF